MLPGGPLPVNWAGCLEPERFFESEPCRWRFVNDGVRVIERILVLAIGEKELGTAADTFVGMFQQFSEGVFVLK